MVPGTTGTPEKKDALPGTTSATSAKSGDITTKVVLNVYPATHGDTGTTSQNSAREKKAKHITWRMSI